MADTYLIVSCPPHGDADPKAVAPCFGQTVAEVGMLLRNPNPRIWFAGSDAAALKQTAATLRENGVRLRMVKGITLTALSTRFNLKGFAFTPDGLECTVDKGKKAVVPYTWKAVSIACRPLEEGHGGAGSLLQAVRDVETRSFGGDGGSDSHRRADNDGSFVDLYFMHLPKVWRFTIRPGLTSFEGLGDRMQPIMQRNVNELLAMLGERFAGSRNDDRLNTPPSPGSGTIGGRAVSAVLADIHPDLKKVEWYDLMSRLTFLAVA
jgi:hypothetical protein